MCADHRESIYCVPLAQQPPRQELELEPTYEEDTRLLARPPTLPMRLADLTTT